MRRLGPGEAAQGTGIPANPDINSPEQDGVSMSQVTIRNGRRWSAADAYLRPARGRRSLDVQPKAQAMGLEFDGDRASGVRWRGPRGRTGVARARREVILAAGAIGSPQLLMLSGIGPAEHLRSLGIEPRVDLGEVGQNLQDHPFFLCCFESTVPESLADAEGPKALAEYVLRRSGPLSSNVGEAMAFIRTRLGLPAADVQLLFGPVYYHDHGFDTSFDGHSFSLAAALITPKSRGQLRLRSADPDAKPELVGNHLAEPEDVASLVAGFDTTVGGAEVDEHGDPVPVGRCDLVGTGIHRRGTLGPAHGIHAGVALEARSRCRSRRTSRHGLRYVQPGQRRCPSGGERYRGRPMERIRPVSHVRRRGGVCCDSSRGVASLPPEAVGR